MTENSQHSDGEDSPTDARSSWQLDAFDRANRTHWLYAAMEDTNPYYVVPSPAGVYHPTAREARAYAWTLSSTFLTAGVAVAVIARNNGASAASLMAGLASGVLAWAMGMALILVARRWAKKRESKNASAGTADNEGVGQEEMT